ncbi:MAG: transglycosylase family protein [Acidimicrobiales bacterium]
MRTRIALVAIAPIVVITITALMQAATVQSARAAAPSGASTTTGPHLPARHHPGPQLNLGPAVARSNLLLDLNTALLTRATGGAAAAPAPAAPSATAPVPAATPAPPTTQAPAPGPIDTVTSAERAAWERVAMCEEGGNWSADSSRFSGGLGITRANWDNYGGRAFAPEGAMATEDQQIMVAERIQPNAPDQYGCRGW